MQTFVCTYTYLRWCRTIVNDYVCVRTFDKISQKIDRWAVINVDIATKKWVSTTMIDVCLFFVRFLIVRNIATVRFVSFLWIILLQTLLCLQNVSFSVYQNAQYTERQFAICTTLKFRSAVAAVAAIASCLLDCRGCEKILRGLIAAHFEPTSNLKLFS